jgi:hypothetical protein
MEEGDVVGIGGVFEFVNIRKCVGKKEGKGHTYEDALEVLGHVHESCRNRERVVNVELGLGNGKYVVRTSVKEREPV